MSDQKVSHIFVSIHIIVGLAVKSCINKEKCNIFKVSLCKINDVFVLFGFKILTVIFTCLLCFYSELPEFKKRPELEVLQMNVSESVIFTCSVRALDQPDLEYHVKWHHNGKLLTSDQMQNSSNMYIHSINETLIEYLQFGDKIFCSVSACDSGNCDETRGPWRESLPFTAQVKVRGVGIEITCRNVQVLHLV